MLLKEETIVITLGDLVFNSHQLGPTEYRLDEAAIDGWYDGAPMRRSSEIRPTGWGDFETPGYLGSRLISITGTAIATNTFELQAMRDIFMSVLPEGGFTFMDVDTPSTGVRSIKVGLEARPQWTRRTDTFASFKMDLIAPDPRMYGTKHVRIIPGSGFNSGMSYPMSYPIDYGLDDPHETQFVGQYGNVEAFPTIKVTGNIPDGFRLTNGGARRVVYDAPVSSMAPVIIDFEEGTATQNGSDRTANLSSREWFGVPPGFAVQPRLEYINQGQGYMEVTLYDTWI